MIVYAGWALAGLIIAVLGLVNAVRSGRSRAHVSVVCMVLAAATGFWFGGRWITVAGDEVVGRMRFTRHRMQYDAIVAQVRQGHNTSGRAEQDGADYIVDVGPPIRVAFPQPGGILDNWEGIVWDPTGSVRAAQGWAFEGGTQHFSAPDDVKRLFGGDIVACEPVSGDYYRCWFT